jgi:transcriptional regulator with XRE-family HTH domain
VASEPVRERPEAEHVGQNVRLYRERKGLSQRALIDAMAARGFTWYQQTVRRVESGIQSLKLEEAAAVADTLGIPVHLLLLPPAETQATDALYGMRRQILAAHGALSGAVAALLEAHSAAEHRARAFAGNPSARVREAAEDLLAAVTEYDADSAITEGIRRYEQGEPHGG